MKTIKKLAALLSIGLMLTMVSSCGDDPPPPENGPSENIYEMVSASAGYAFTIQAIDKAGLKSMLTASSTVTFFPPSDDGWLAAGLDVNTMSEAELRKIMEYHMVSGNKAVSDFPDGGYVGSKLLDSMNGRAVSIFTEHPVNVLELNGYQAVETKEAKNGRVHFMNDLLLPLHIVGHLNANPDLTKYFNAVELRSAHSANLKGSTNYTVFATNLEGMNAFLNEQGKSLQNLHPDIIRDFLYNSTIEGQGKFTSELIKPETTLGNDLDISSGGEVIAGDINVVMKNIQCTNGVIHIVDGVVYP